MLIAAAGAKDGIVVTASLLPSAATAVRADLQRMHGAGARTAPQPLRRRELSGLLCESGAQYAGSAMDYWNAELETLPWPEVERWQATRIGAALPALRARSALYAEAHAGLPAETALRSL